MKFLLSICLGLSSVGLALAQPALSVSAPAPTPAQLTLSLAEARAVGLRNRFDVQANAYDVAVAELDVTRRRQAWLPEVRATGAVTFNSQLQATLIPAGFSGLPEPQLLALGARSVSTFGLSLTQPVLDAPRRTDVRLARAALTTQQERVRGQQLDIKNQISQAYLDVVLRRLQLRIARREEERFQAYVTLSEGRFQHGALVEKDLLRARLDQQNAHVQALTSAQQVELSLRTLRTRLNVPPTTTLVLTDTLTAPGTLAAVVADSALAGNRPEIRQLLAQQQTQALTLQRQRQATLLTLSLVGNYSEQYLNADFNYNYLDRKWWSPFNYVGVQLALPLTQQLTNRAAVRQAAERQLQTSAQLRQTRLNVAYEIDYAAQQVANALANLELTRQALALSQQVYRNQQQQYALGALQYDEVLTTERSLLSTEQNYVSAAYGYLSARLQYEVATGSL